jgi:hypothetical protein
MYSGAARSASAIFSSVVGSLLSAMVTELQHSERIVHQYLHLPISSPFHPQLTFQPFMNFASRSLSPDRHTSPRVVAQTRARPVRSTPSPLPIDPSIGPIWFAMGPVPSSYNPSMVRPDRRVHGDLSDQAFFVDH